MKMLKTIFLASLAIAPVTVPATAFAGEIAAETVQVGYALGNVAEDALDLAAAYEKLPAVQGTYAAYYLHQLVDDNDLLVIKAHELALLLDANYPDHAAIAAKWGEVTTSYNRVKNGADKAVQQLFAQSLTSQGYQLKAAYTKVRSRYVYLQTAIAGR